MTQTIILPLIVPLLTALISVLLRKSFLRDYVSFSGALFYLISVLLLSSKVASQGTISYQAGGWTAPYGITIVADHLAIFMLVLTGIVSLAVNIYSWGYITDKGKSSGYYIFQNFMITGMTGAFLAGDLFNLFVMFEIVLMASYALVSFSGSKESLFISLKYVVLNLIGSSLMLVAIGGLYSITGTLNMADMAIVLSEGSVNMAPVLGLLSILFSVFAIKSGMVPFHFWAPPVYANSPPPPSALMAGISKKVGVYAVIRLYITIFSTAKMPETSLMMPGESVNYFVGLLTMGMASLTIVLGGIGALNRESLDKLLSYSSLGQMGFIFLPIGLVMITGHIQPLAAALLYVLAHALAKPVLFMLSGLIEKSTDERKFNNLGGLSEESFVLSASFFVAIFSLVGIPPLTGFFAKFTVFRSIFASGHTYLLGILVLGSLMTILYASRSWMEIFFGKPVETDISVISKKEVFSIIILVVLLVVIGVHMEPVYQFIEKAAQDAIQTSSYTEAVVGDKP